MLRTAESAAGDWVLVTGATGFLGAALVHELICRSRRVLCLVRAATPAEARSRLTAALRPWRADTERLLESGLLAVVRGDVLAADVGTSSDVIVRLRGSVSAVVHSAGNTRFSETATGEPHRTNVEGTGNVLALARKLECRDWHFISTAFVAGEADEASEAIATEPPPFRNAYEQSKWQAERSALSAADDAGATLTIYRPSSIVGHSANGQASLFNGVYYLFRATGLIARAIEQHPEYDRHAIPLRIPASSQNRPNLICIDDVATAFGVLFDSPEARGGIYHLTHPDPPTNGQIRRVLESHYDIAGGRFAVDEVAAAAADRDSPIQQLFDEMTEAVRDYLFDAPRFERTKISRFVNQPPAPWTDDRLLRLIEAAESSGWRTVEADRQEGSDDARELSAYFEDFLPARIAGSALGGARQLDVTVRFAIGKRPEGMWLCRFVGGRVDVAKSSEGQPADVTYRTSVSRFRAAVAGEISGAELFLSGAAQVEGDIERALKFATFLDEFVRANPYRRTGEAEPAESP